MSELPAGSADAQALRERILSLRGLDPGGGSEPEGAEAEDAEARRLIGVLADAEILSALVPAPFGGRRPRVSNHEVCGAREALAFTSGMADAVFALQGLGSAGVALAGGPDQKGTYLPRVARGTSIAAIALTEPEAGSDLSAIATLARRDGESYVLDGAKTLISNAGLADFYTIFARTSPDRRRGVSAFVVESGDRGLRVTGRFRGLAPHPIGSLALEGCRVPASRRLGEEGGGMEIARAILDFYRPTVGAAAVGMARRALAESVAHLKSRRQFGAPLADLQGLRSMLADMATEIEAAALLVERASGAVDSGRARTARESAMAKYAATETAQRVIDRAVQMRGGMGVMRGAVVERLYREVRALRIYEGATEVQKDIIAREILRAWPGAARA